MTINLEPNDFPVLVLGNEPIQVLFRIHRDDNLCPPEHGHDKDQDARKDLFRPFYSRSKHFSRDSLDSSERLGSGEREDDREDEEGEEEELEGVGEEEVAYERGVEEDDSETSRDRRSGAGWDRDHVERPVICGRGHSE